MMLTHTQRELNTARLVLASFEDQLAQLAAHEAKGRRARRYDIAHGLFDRTIIDRRDMLEAGRAKWTERVARLEEWNGTQDPRTAPDEWPSTAIAPGNAPGSPDPEPHDS